MSWYYSHSFHQVTTKEHDFGLGAPVSEAEKYQNILQLEQGVRNQDKFISTLKLQVTRSFCAYVPKLIWDGGLY